MIDLGEQPSFEGLWASVDVPDAVLQHGENVAALALRVAHVLGMNPYDRLMLVWGARIHDVGKAHLPMSILDKPGSLSTTERGLIEQHAPWGARMLPHVPVKVREIVLHHHERWDGHGYPEGLSGVHIPFLARVVAVCDVFDALLTDRPYRSAWTRDAALNFVREQSGRMFDPHVVSAFFEAIERPRPS